MEIRELPHVWRRFDGQPIGTWRSRWSDKSSFIDKAGDEHLEDGSAFIFTGEIPWYCLEVWSGLQSNRV